MSKIEVLTYPNPKLNRIAEPVRNAAEGHRIASKIVAAAQELHWGKVAGLAAPQIGINKRIFLANGEIFINPEILWVPNDQKFFLEGCFSLTTRKFDYRIRRPYAVKLRWHAENWEVFEERFNGHKAQVILHEFDHLEGKLCNWQELQNAGD